MDSRSKITTVLRLADNTTVPVTLERTIGGTLRVVTEHAPKPDAKRTKCRNGHPISYTYRDKRGQARCRLCIAAWWERQAQQCSQS